MFRLIASDLDGTIFNKQDSIPQDNLKAIDDLHKKQIPFAICTGKTYSVSKDLCKDLHANFGIFGNGNQIINLATGEEIARRTLTLAEIRTCFSMIQNQNLHVHAYTENSIITTKLMYMDLRTSILSKGKMNFQIVPSVLDYIEKENPIILKLVISSPSNLSKLKEDFEEKTNFSITYVKKTGIYKDAVIDKEYEYLDISPSDVTKGNALEQLRNYLHLQKEEVLSIGDNINDIPMFEASGMGVAVNNSYEEVKKVADFTTSQSAENGAFAEAVYKFI